MSIAIIKYNAGNVTSVKNALDRLGFESVITNDENEIRSAERVIFPGVGEASSAMTYLKDNNLIDLIRSLKQPVLGICLGMQLMCDFSEEGNSKCLGIFNTAVKKFPATGVIPQMGWNNLTIQKSKLLEGIKSNDDVYFVHSYYAENCKETVATCDYLVSFSAVLEKNNFYATQFHPEKSGKVGEQILLNFLKL